MKNCFLYLIGLLFCLSSYGQEYITVFRNPQDSSFNSYLLVLPKAKEEIGGLIVRDYSRLPNASKKSRYRWIELAIENNLAMLYTCTSDYFPELYYNDAPAMLLDSILNEVLVKYTIPKQNVFIGGMSASGTRALQFEKFLRQGKSKFENKLAGVFICDSPLDFERFYYSAEDILKRNHPKGMNEEAKWMMKSFPLKLGGTPYEVEAAYRKASVFSYLAVSGGNAAYFKETPLLFFHEPDMDWWMAERNATYKDINSFDIVGFHKALLNLGNNDVQVIATSNKDFDAEGERKPHSWTIVDESILIDWIVKRCTE